MNTETKTHTITDEVILQASNIDEKGNVLYLDQARLDRKVVGFERFRNKRNGLGIYNFLKVHVFHLNDKRWPIARFLYKKIIKYSVWLKEGGLKAKLYKRVTKLEPDMKKNTGTVILPLNVDMPDAIAAYENSGYFVSSYAMTFFTEDRATLMSQIMSDKTLLQENPGMAAKMRYYAACIRDCFDTEGWPETTVWELEP